jgi:zinc protease
MRNPYVLILAVILSLSHLAQASVSEQVRFPVEKFQLDNGLTVLIHENHTVPIISYQQWFRVGSSFEKPGRTGLAHFFEHLMFKGTQKYPNGVFDRIIQMNGGNNNAFTTEDYTGYYTNLPSDKLELIIDIESDRMRNLLFEEKEITSEREVVKEERRMRYENSVYGSLFEELRSTVYKTGPYHWPVIGYMADLNATKTEELKTFYNAYYAPNNAVVVVAGDVTVSQVKKLVEKYYGNIKRQELPPFQPPTEVEQKSPRASALEKDVQSVTIAMAYPGVKAGHEDSYALDLMTAAMGSGNSSRLHKRLVYKNQLATQASMSNEADKLSGELNVVVSFVPGADVERGIGLIQQELNQIKRTPISDDELKKVKNEIMLGYVQGLQTMAQRAQSLAQNEIFYGDYKKLFTDLEKYEAVTKDDILRVAKLYILPNKLSTVRIVPKAKAGGEK